MVVICWLVFCFLVGKFAQKRGRNFWKFVILSAIISPIGGVIVLLIVGEKQTSEVQGYADSSSYTQSSDFNSIPRAGTNRPFGIHLSQIEKSSEPTSSFCPNCGTPIDSATIFCPQCGAKIENND